MVYTVTFNPSLDYIVRMNDFKSGMVNRTESETIYPGGKGINVSVILSNLGVENTALGFIAGFTGDEIERSVAESGCNAEFIRVKEGFSRINVKIKSSQESEINGKGPQITSEDIEKLFERLSGIQDGDTLVMAGSIPSTLPDFMYMDVLERLKDKDLRIVVDATGKLLKNVLPYKPFLIKPNNHEMEEIFDTKIESEEELISYGKKLQEMGARNVLISRAGDGSILISEDGDVIIEGVARGTVLNSVGAGDSMVAGFVAGYAEKQDYRYALKLGTASGGATAFSDGLATREKILEVLNQIL